VENKIKRIEELGDGEWIGHFSILHKKLQGSINSLHRCLTASRLSKLSFDCGKISYGASQRSVSTSEIVETIFF
jgi:hypothetical protein